MKDPRDLKDLTPKQVRDAIAESSEAAYESLPMGEALKLLRLFPGALSVPRRAYLPGPEAGLSVPRRAYLSRAILSILGRACLSRDESTVVCTVRKQP